METHFLRIFQREVERQSRFALIAIQDLVQSLEDRDLDRLWYSAQAFLIAVGNVSKLLWPSTPRFPNRGAELRESLLVSDDSQIKPRKFRNHFEHFDERLEDWIASSERHNYVDSSVGSPNLVKGLEPGDYLRNFDTKNFALTYRGDTFFLRPIIEAIKELWKKAETEVMKPSWL